MATLSNLSIRSNLMVDDEAHLPRDQYLPGDFLYLVKPWIFDRRVSGDFTHEQLMEYERYLVCGLCGRTCAGICERK